MSDPHDRKLYQWAQRVSLFSPSHHSFSASSLMAVIARVISEGHCLQHCHFWASHTLKIVSDMFYGGSCHICFIWSIHTTLDDRTSLFQNLSLKKLATLIVNKQNLSKDMTFCFLITANNLTLRKGQWGTAVFQTYSFPTTIKWLNLILVQLFLLTHSLNSLINI